jgi:hypothetical protein
MKSVKMPCQAKKTNGAKCQAAALPSTDFCFFHDPDQADKRRASQSFGGSQNRMTTLDDDAPDVTVRNCEDVVKLMGETINHVRKGQLDPRIANAVGYLAAILIKAAEQGDMEKRIADIEALVKNRRETPDLNLDMTGTYDNR